MMKESENNKNNTIKEIKLPEAVFGLAIGDALGVPYEFKARGSFECKGWSGFGNFPAGAMGASKIARLISIRSVYRRA